MAAPTWRRFPLLLFVLAGHATTGAKFTYSVGSSQFDFILLVFLGCFECALLLLDFLALPGGERRQRHLWVGRSDGCLTFEPRPSVHVCLQVQVYVPGPLAFLCVRGLFTFVCGVGWAGARGRGRGGKWGTRVRTGGVALKARWAWVVWRGVKARRTLVVLGPSAALSWSTSSSIVSVSFSASSRLRSFLRT